MERSVLMRRKAVWRMSTLSRPSQVHPVLRQATATDPIGMLNCERA